MCHVVGHVQDVREGTVRPLRLPTGWREAGLLVLQQQWGLNGHTRGLRGSSTCGGPARVHLQSCRGQSSTSQLHRAETANVCGKDAPL